jgi:hypothetical protein
VVFPRWCTRGDHRLAATAIGVQIGVVTEASAAALVAAGLLSVVIFPALGLALLRGGAPSATPETAPAEVYPVLTAEDRALCRREQPAPTPA